MSLKVMVVDDEPRSSALLRTVAVPMGYLVQPFDDYELAAKRGEAQAFDAIFVGMGASEPTGFELVRRLRHAEPNRDSVVVMLSPTNDVTALRKAFGEGADLFLVKPIQPDRLQRMLAAFPEWKGKRVAARLPFFGDVLCNWSGGQVQLRSSNISESGMLLHPAPEVEVGEQVQLEFKIPEVLSPLNVVARVVRKDGAQGLGVQFIDLGPEDAKAIHGYVKGRRHAVRLPFFGDVLCNWNSGQVHLRSSNISESGMLLHPAPEVGVGEQVQLEFRIAEIRSSLRVAARVVRNDGPQGLGVQFIDLRPEDLNAIQLYITGRAKSLARPAAAFLSRTKSRRLFDP